MNLIEAVSSGLLYRRKGEEKWLGSGDGLAVTKEDILADDWETKTWSDGCDVAERIESLLFERTKDAAK